jgi:hypothetical protein
LIMHEPRSVFWEALRARTGGIRYVAYPQHNHRVLLPDWGHRTATLARSFHNSGLTAFVDEVRLRTGGGRTVFLDADLVDALRLGVEARIGRPNLKLGFLLGAPGAYQKIVGVAWLPSGHPAAFMKIADSQNTRLRVTREAEALADLRNAGVTDVVPRALGMIEVPPGLALILTPGPSRPGPRRLSELHLNFFERIRNATGGSGFLKDSNTWQDVKERKDLLFGSLSNHAGVRAEEAFDYATQLMGDSKMPLWLAHGDFARWNTRTTPDGALFTLDWEAARSDMLPLHDHFFFELSRAVRRDGLAWGPLQRGVASAAFRLWPEGRSQLPALRAMSVLWTTLQYAQARQIDNRGGSGPVWTWLERAWSRFRVPDR